jgi:hypothetical protein
MTRIEAHSRFAMMKDRSFIQCREFDNDPHWVAITTAFAELSGLLDDCRTDNDLREAAAHGETLYATFVVSEDEVTEIAQAVILEVMALGEQQGATCTDS